MYARARGRARTYQAKSRWHMLHMLCNTSGTLKNLPNLSFTVLHLYITTGAVNGYGFLILTFL